MISTNVRLFKGPIQAAAMISPTKLLMRQTSEDKQNNIEAILKIVTLPTQSQSIPPTMLPTYMS